MARRHDGCHLGIGATLEMELFFPLRDLGQVVLRIVWITEGMHPSTGKLIWQGEIVLTEHVDMLSQ